MILLQKGDFTEFTAASSLA